MIPGKRYTADTLLKIAWRRKWLIVLPAVLIAAAAAAWIYRLPNVYRADTLILVVPQRVPESYVRSTVTTRIEDRLQSISQQILSRTRLEQIVQDFNLYPERRSTRGDGRHRRADAERGHQYRDRERRRVPRQLHGPAAAHRDARHRTSRLAVHRREPARSRGARRRDESVSRGAARRGPAQAGGEREDPRGVSAASTTASCRPS